MIEIHEQATSFAAVLRSAASPPDAPPSPPGGSGFAATLDQVLAAATSTPATTPAPSSATTPATAPASTATPPAATATAPATTSAPSTPAATTTTVHSNSAGQLVSDFVLGSQVYAGDDNCYASTATGFFQGQPTATYYAGTGQGISLAEISQAFYGHPGKDNLQAFAAIKAANPGVTWPADPTSPLPVGTQLTIPDLSGTIAGAF